MKYFYSLLAGLIFPTFVFSQCLADAGPDQHACSNFQNTDTVQLGGQPTASGGAAPYVYKWSFINPPGSLFNFKASVLLNDTTIANPEFYGNGISDSSTFVLEVVDNNSISCFDTVVITESIFVSNLGQYGMSVNAGDTITFLFGSNISGNLPVREYLWRPNHGMIDSTSLNPTVAPTKSMAYHVVVTDSAGCTLEGGDYVIVTVNHVGLDESNIVDDIRLYPNPTQNYFQISFPQELSTNQLSISIMDVNGSTLEQFYHAGGAEFRRNISLPAGIYIVKAQHDDTLVGSYKFVVEH